MRIDPQCVWKDFQAIKENAPLIHNITNYVVMEQTANSLLAIGASPVMAHALEEVEEMAMSADSLVLNIGTLSSPWVAGMMLALKVANIKGIPVVFDPVGSGATSFRTETANAILDHGTVTAIRGNASEILSLNGNPSISRGVDSLSFAENHIKQAMSLANKHQCIIWMSGKTDVVTDGSSRFLIHNGNQLMGKVTGMGCTATALSGAFLAVNKNHLIGSVNAAVLMGIAGEIASENVRGPGSFKVAFIDALYNITLEDIERRMKVEAL